MGREFISWAWRKLPQYVRRMIMRATQPTFTVSAGAVIFDAEGRVLLLHHVLRPACGWGVPGGFLQKGEQPIDAVIRELREEAGLELENLQFVTARTTPGHIEIIYRCGATNPSEARPCSSEINEARWFKLDELPAELERRQRGLINCACDVGENK